MKIRTLLMGTMVIAGYLMMGAEGCQSSSKEMTSAKMYISQKEYNKALDMLDTEISKNPSNPEAYYMKGNILFDMNRFEEMAAAYRQGAVVGYTPQQKDVVNSRLQNAWGQTMNKAIDEMKKSEDETGYLKSADIFKKAIEILPDSVTAYYNKAIAYFNAKKYDDVRQTAKEYIAKSHETQEVVQLVVVTYYNEKKYDDAITYLNQFRNSNYVPQNWVLENIAQTYINADKAEQALASFLEAANASPSNEALQYNVGVLYLNSEKYEEAVKHFTNALDIKEDYTEARYNLGVTYLRMAKKRHAEIEDAYSKEKDRKKRDKIASDRSFLEFYKLALPHLEMVKDNREDDYAFWNVLGQVYTALGMNEKAKDAFDHLK